MLEEAMFDRVDRSILEGIENIDSFFVHKSRSIDVYFERYLKRLVRLVLLDQE